MSPVETQRDEADPLRTRYQTDDDATGTDAAPAGLDPTEAHGQEAQTLRLPQGSSAHVPAHPELEPTAPEHTRYQGDGGTDLNTPPSTLIEPGRVLFGKYRVIRRLGGGAMGDVWLVRHVSLNRDHALKMIVPHLASHGGALVRFQREFHVMASFHHEHAIEIYDARLDEDGGYIDMQYVEGRTLAELLDLSRARPDRDPSAPLFPLPSVARILGQLCDVLDVAHEAGIVHRDLKPSNLMLVGDRPSGQEFLKVLDFGIAKIRNDPDNKFNDASLTGGFIGTPSYSSPEQVYGRAVDGRSDLYSVGVLLYEILCGQLPFVGTQVQVMMQHAQQPPPGFAEANPDLAVGPDLERLVMRLLAKDPADRPATGRELYAAFAVAAPTEVRSGVTEWQAPGRVGPPAPPGLSGNPPSILPATGAGVAAEAAPPARPRRVWAGIALAGFLAAGLSARSHRMIWNPSAPRVDPGRGNPAGIGGPSEPARKIPDGYERVENLRFYGGWPSELRSEGSMETYHYRAPNVYLPARFEAVPAVGPPELVEGWPRVLALHNDPTHARYVRITGGRRFMMGAWNAPDNPDRPDAPAHPVILSGFYMQDREVSNGQLERFYASNPVKAPSRWRDAYDLLIKDVGPAQAALHPAVNITRAEASEYAHSFGAMLPTEAQWEYAARSLGKNQLYVWVEDSSSSDLANIGSDRADVTTCRCGLYKTDMTEQEIFDMAGNVQEWCRDVQAAYTRPDRALVNPWRKPKQPGGNLRYAIRGGSYALSPEYAEVTHRSDSKPEPDYASLDLGFRVVIECPDFENRP